MGSVWIAENLAIEATVAVKLLHQALADDLQAVKRFELEAKSAARLRHRNIVSVFDLGALDDGAPFIVMELMQGESLERIMQRRGRLAADELLGVVLPVLGALSVAHSSQIIHRDLKPENIFLSVDPDGSTTPKIVDFGVSKMATIDRGTRMTRTGMIVGTPIYMPPEQASGREVDGRADLWAVGVIMYEALSGQLPYDGDNYNTLVASILTQEAKPLGMIAPEVDGELAVLVMRALERDLERRFASADVFAAELGAWLVRRGLPVPPRCPEVSVVHSAETLGSAGAVLDRPRRPEPVVARPAPVDASITRARSGSPLRGVLLGAAVTVLAIGGGAVAFVVARGAPDEATAANETSAPNAPDPSPAAIPTTAPTPPIVAPSTVAATIPATQAAAGSAHAVTPPVPAPAPEPPRVVGVHAPAPAPLDTTASPALEQHAPRPSVVAAPSVAAPSVAPPSVAPPSVATPRPSVVDAPRTTPADPPRAAPPSSTPAIVRAASPPAGAAAARDRPRRPVRERAAPIAPLLAPRTGPRLPSSPGF